MHWKEFEDIGTTNALMHLSIYVLSLRTIPPVTATRVTGHLETLTGTASRASEEALFGAFLSITFFYLNVEKLVDFSFSSGNEPTRKKREQ